ncbi:MAG: UvrD-helicase domain-containing protein [Planctomycetota bacterium]
MKRREVLGHGVPASAGSAAPALGRLTLCGASAGTGKTYSICELIAERVVRHGLDPARLIATTFTIKAAAELKGRIAARLLEDGVDPSWAERLELAPIGTVHSVAYQLLTRYALHLGLSPRLSVADETASDRLLRLNVQRLDPGPWDALSELARRLGQDDLALTLLALIQEKRISAIDDVTFREQMAANAEQFVAILLAGAPARRAGATPTLQAAQQVAATALDRLAAISCGTKKTADARKRLREISGGAHVSWRDVVRLGRIDAGKRSGADAALRDVRDFASGVRTFAELHADVRQFMTLLTEQTIALERSYLAYKKERGLLDFTDLEVEFLRLLRGELAEDVAAGFDLVVVDEFQDTNPLQLAIFTRLRELTPESYWVGDEKQSIFGFRGTDARLMQEVWEKSTPDERRTLETNYRSQRGLVDLVNRVFVPVFGEEATMLAQRDALDRARPGVARWILNVNSNDDEAAAIARGIARLHREGKTPLADIAALVRTNEQGRQLGAALDRLDVPSVIELPGLLQTRECVVALAGLRLVADRRDSLAAATVVHHLSEATDGTPAWFADRLREVLTEEPNASDRATSGAASPGRGVTPRAHSVPWNGHPTLAILDELAPQAGALTPSETLSAVIAALAIPFRAAAWRAPGMRCGNLDALLGHARKYEREAVDSGRPATLTGLIAHLERLSAEEQDMRVPPTGLDAVTIATYHLAKGLEWPTVVLTGLDHQRSPDLFRPSTSGGDPAASDPLRGRRIHYWPWPFGRGTRGQLTSGSDLEHDTQRTPEGAAAVATEREESLRLLYVGFTRARDHLVIAHRQGKHAWLDELPSLLQVLGRVPVLGSHEIEGVSTRVEVELFTDESREARPGGRAEPVGESPSIRWLDPRRVREEERSGEPAYVSPSDAPGNLDGARLEVLELPGVPATGPGLHVHEGDEANVGSAVHAYFASLPSVRALDRSGRERVAARCLEAYGCEAVISAADLVVAGERFQAWIAERTASSQWFTETHVTAPRAGDPNETRAARWGQPQTWGTIDLLLVSGPRGAHSVASVIDHKTGTPGRSGERAYAAQYVGQIEAYRNALSAAGVDAQAWLHLPLGRGVMIRVREPGAGTDAAKDPHRPAGSAQD